MSDMFCPYVSRPVMNGEVIALWAQECGATNTLRPSDMHVTIIYSRSPVIKASIEPLTNMLEVTLVNVLPKKIASSLALPIYYPEIEARHRELLEIGATHDYADGVFRPHISIIYDGKEEDIELFGFGRTFDGIIELGPETVAPLKVGWRPSPATHWPIK